MKQKQQKQLIGRCGGEGAGNEREQRHSCAYSR